MIRPTALGLLLTITLTAWNSTEAYAQASISGPSCGGMSAQVLSQPRLGAMFTIGFSGAPTFANSMMAFGAPERFGPIDLTIFGAPGCLFQMDSSAYAAFPLVADASGAILCSHLVRNDPNDIGVAGAIQFFAMDMSANALGVIVSARIDWAIAP